MGVQRWQPPSASPSLHTDTCRHLAEARRAGGGSGGSSAPSRLPSAWDWGPCSDMAAVLCPHRSPTPLHTWLGMKAEGEAHVLLGSASAAFVSVARSVSSPVVRAWAQHALRPSAPLWVLLLLPPGQARPGSQWQSSVKAAGSPGAPLPAAAHQAAPWGPRQVPTSRLLAKRRALPAAEPTEPQLPSDSRILPGETASRAGSKLSLLT